MDSFAARIVPKHPSAATYEWKIVRCLCYRLDVVEYQLKRAEDKSKLKFLLTLFLDEHLDLYNYIVNTEMDQWSVKTMMGLFPTPDRILWFGNCLDTMTYIKESGFWDLVGIKRHPMVHLFTKSLPHRCQNRNMQTLALKYMNEFPTIMTFFKQILQCSILGNSMRCRSACFKYRCIIYKERDNGKLWKTMMGKYFPVVLHALKEHILYCVEQLPSLAHTLVLKQRWVEFKEGIYKILAPVRVAMSKSPRTDTSIDSVEGILSLMQRTSKYNLGRHIHHHTTAFHVHETRFKSTTKRIAIAIDKCDDGPYDNFILLYNIACRIPIRVHEIPWYILAAFGIPRRVIKALYTAKKGKVQFDCTDLQKNTITMFLDVLTLRFGIKCYPLPLHMQKMQTKAIMAQHGMAPGSTDEEVSSKCMPFVFCARCKTYKGFLNFISDKGRPILGYGNKDILVNDGTGELYCANHKNHKNSQNKKQVDGIISSLQKKHRTNKKQNRHRVSKYRRCEQTPLLKFSSYGVCVSFFGVIFMRCPFCMCPCRYEKMTFSSGHLMCVVCAFHKKTI